MKSDLLGSILKSHEEQARLLIEKARRCKEKYHGTPDVVYDSMEERLQFFIRLTQQREVFDPLDTHDLESVLECISLWCLRTYEKVTPSSNVDH